MNWVGQNGVHGEEDALVVSSKDFGWNPSNKDTKTEVRAVP